MVARNHLRAVAGSDDQTFAWARREWEDRLAAPAKRIRNLQLALAAAGLLIAVLSAYVFILGNQAKTIPYVIEVDKLGTAVAFGPAAELGRSSEVLERYLLAGWITKTRSVLVDKVAQEQYLVDSLAYVKGDARQYLDQWLVSRQGAALDRRAQISVTPLSILRLSPDTWRIEWREVSYDSGRALTDEYWQAAVRVEHHPPKLEDALLRNPLGLYVADLNWSRVNAPAPQAPQLP